MKSKNSFAPVGDHGRLRELRNDGWPCAPLPKAKTLAEVLEEVPPTRTYILPGLIAYGETTLVHVAKGVNSDLFAAMVAYACAYRKKLAPYGSGAGETVLQCCGTGHEASERKTHELITQSDKDSVYESDIGANLRFQARFHEDGSLVNLCSKTDQQLFLEALPEDTKLVVFPEIEAWISNEPVHDPFDASSIIDFLAELNRRGIAVLMFVRSAKKPFQPRFPRQAMRPNLVWLIPDPTAPNEIGGGFCVSRNKMDEEDPVPTKYRFWYSTTDGLLQWGWDFVTDISASEAKQLAINERRIKVAKLIDDGMPQKAISQILGVDAATISRDVSTLNLYRDAPQLDNPDE